MKNCWDRTPAYNADCSAFPPCHKTILSILLLIKFMFRKFSTMPNSLTGVSMPAEMKIITIHSPIQMKNTFIREITSRTHAHGLLWWWMVYDSFFYEFDFGRHFSKTVSRFCYQTVQRLCYQCTVLCRVGRIQSVACFKNMMQNKKIKK